MLELGSYGVLLVATCAFVEGLLRLPVLQRVKHMRATLARVRFVFSARSVSDHWKEKVLLAYAVWLWVDSAVLLLLMGMLGAPLFLGFDVLSRSGVFDAEVLTSSSGIIVATLTGTAYGVMRTRCRKKQIADQHKYGLLERGLHRLALGSNMVAHASFDAEQAYLTRRFGALPEPAHPVFVVGLARAGTTLLMRLLYETGLFGSLTYRDMPFLLAPNLWGKLSHHFAKTAVAEERVHGDGLMVDFDSPEALEEVFWRVMCSEGYIQAACLKPMTADSAVQGDFRKYIAAVMHPYPGKRYLSKNNNNILRLGSLRRAFPDAAILVPFRDPIAQARSLLQQDQHFCAMHEHDAFAQSYMTWLAHYEFGAGHRPFIWGLGTQYNRDTIDYWLFQWIGAYQYLLTLAHDSGLNLIFVGYEDLCASPTEVWESLQKVLAIEEPLPSSLKIAALREGGTFDVDNELAAIAQKIYLELSALSRQTLALN